MTPPEQTAEIASLKATVRAQALEIRDLKKMLGTVSTEMTSAIKELTASQAEMALQVQPVVKSAEKLEKLITEADRADGMKSLATMLIGGGFFASAGAALLGLFQYFSKGGS